MRARVPGHQDADGLELEGRRHQVHLDLAHILLSCRARHRGDQLRVLDRQHRRAEIGYTQADAATMSRGSELLIHHGSLIAHHRHHDVGI